MNSRERWRLCSENRLAMKQDVTPKLNKRRWASMETVPAHGEIDIFWVNHTISETPVSGIMLYCLAEKPYYRSALNAGVIPMQYAMFWRKSLFHE